MTEIGTTKFWLRGTDLNINDNNIRIIADELVATKTSETSVSVVCRIRPAYDRNINIKTTYTNVVISP